MPMLHSLKNIAKELGKGHPGQRFQMRYHRRQRVPRGSLRRVLFIGGGILLVAAGVLLLAAPGPGVLVVFLGGSLIAEESLIAARALDWMEVRLRPVATWGFHLWQKASLPLRVVLAVAVITAVVGTVYAGYRLWF
jgi:hypothetical protein